MMIFDAFFSDLWMFEIFCKRKKSTLLISSCDFLLAPILRQKGRATFRHCCLYTTQLANTTSLWLRTQWLRHIKDKGNFVGADFSFMYTLELFLMYHVSQGSTEVVLFNSLIFLRQQGQILQFGFFSGSTDQRRADLTEVVFTNKFVSMITLPWSLHYRESQKLFLQNADTMWYTVSLDVFMILNGSKYT